MVKEFVAIAGPSGVGKRTLVEALGDNEPGLRERFGIPAGATAQTFVRAFDPLNPDHVQADYVVWKWQKNTHHLLTTIGQQFPDSANRLVYLWLPPPEHFHRMANSKKPQHREEAKRKAGKGGAKEGAAKLEGSHLRYWEEYFCDLQRLGVCVEVVDGSTSLYDSVDWPNP